MKCATLTFHRTTNYGATFQTYALQKVIVDNGIETEVIDYRPSLIEERYETYSLKKYLDLKFLLKIFLKNSYIRDNKKNFNDFRKKYIKISPKIYNENTIKECNSLYDKFIVGSDQVWNPNCMGWDKNYLLSFADSNKKFSYAASFGIENATQKEFSWFKKYLYGYSVASVREKTGAKLYKTITDLDAHTVLDPTFLVRDEWIKIALSQSRLIKEDYVLIYLMKETSSIFKEAKAYARANNLKVIYINDRLFGHVGISSRYYTKPIDWLNLFYHANCIFTNSFHGTAFSLIFNKLFFVELLPPPSKVNSRICDLLQTVKVNNIISSGMSINDIRINYSEVNSILKGEVKRSLNIINQILL